VSGAVLLHGFTGSPQSFEELARRLRARRPGVRLYRPTLIGHECLVAGCRSESSGRPASLEHADRFEQEVDRLARGIHGARFAGAHLCGYSLGARVALGLLARYPYLFSGATLIGVHPGLSSLHERAARVGSDERWCQVLLSGGLATFLDAWQAQPIFRSQRGLPHASAAEQRRIRSAHDAAGLIRSLRVLGLGHMPDYRGVLRSVPIPLRLMVGARDDKFVAIARELAAASPRLELDLVEGVGHNVLLEAPEHVESVLMRALAA
jgi:2-succinyl-6-hydroxy-2,4-cyclohexadiene-1-carboxylate synthase